MLPGPPENAPVPVAGLIDATSKCGDGFSCAKEKAAVNSHAMCANQTLFSIGRL